MSRTHYQATSLLPPSYEFVVLSSSRAIEKLNSDNHIDANRTAREVILELADFDGFEQIDEEVISTTAPLIQEDSNSTKLNRSKTLTGNDSDFEFSPKVGKRRSSAQANTLVTTRVKGEDSAMRILAKRLKRGWRHVPRNLTQQCEDSKIQTFEKDVPTLNTITAVLPELRGRTELPILCYANQSRLCLGPRIPPQTLMYRRSGHRKFCAVCGKIAKYTCKLCGTHYCCLRCNETHEETRCQKNVR